MSKKCKTNIKVILYASRFFFFFMQKQNNNNNNNNNNSNSIFSLECVIAGSIKNSCHAGFSTSYVHSALLFAASKPGRYMLFPGVTWYNSQFPFNQSERDFFTETMNLNAKEATQMVLEEENFIASMVA